MITENYLKLRLNLRKHMWIVDQFRPLGASTYIQPQKTLTVDGPNAVLFVFFNRAQAPAIGQILREVVTESMKARTCFLNYHVQAEALLGSRDA